MENKENIKIYRKFLKTVKEEFTKWNIEEFKGYILGIIFFKFLSDKLEEYLNTTLIKENKEINKINTYSENDQIRIKNNCIKYIEYYFDPEYLYDEIIKLDNNKLISSLQKIFDEISDCSNNENNFKNFFSIINLKSSNLGENKNERADVIRTLMIKIEKLIIEIQQNQKEEIGEIYEFLIKDFNKEIVKNGENFYTSPSVSKLIGKIATLNKTEIKNVYDPTCGSGSLLLRVNEEIIANNNNSKQGIDKIYGQELNLYTSILAKMNLFLHKISSENFYIHNEDSLNNDFFLNKKINDNKDKFDLIVANPPFGKKWKWNIEKEFSQDPRFLEYDSLEPDSMGDYHFIQHMLYHLEPNNGVMVTLSSSGVLTRKKSKEYNIRKYIISHQNSLDTIINLPENVLFGKKVLAVILVFKKNRNNCKNIFFIDASLDYKKEGNKNMLTNENIDKIIEVYKTKEEIEKYSKLVPIKEIEDNNYNLNFSYYIDIYDEIIYRDLKEIENDLLNLKIKKEQLKTNIIKQKEQLKKY